MLSWHWEPLVIQERFRRPFAALSWLRPLSWREHVKMFQESGSRSVSLGTAFTQSLSPFSERSVPVMLNHTSPLSRVLVSALGWWSRRDYREKWDLSGPQFLDLTSLFAGLWFWGIRALSVFRLRV